MDPKLRAVRRLVAFRRGVLALDTAPAVLAARLRAVHVVPTPRVVESYLTMLLGAAGLERAVSAVAFSHGGLEDCRRPSALTARLSAAGTLYGFRADTGHEPVGADPRDRVTSGLDGLVARLLRFREAGAAFAVWSTMAGPDADPGGMRVLTTNSHAAARFAHVCQDLGLVAVVRVGTRGDPADGPVRDATTAAALLSLGGHLVDQDVDPSAVVVCTEVRTDVDAEVACRPLSVLPTGLGGLLLAGRGDEVAATATAVAAGAATAPRWPLGFWVGRQVTMPALRLWRGRPERVAQGRCALLAGLDHVFASATVRPGRAVRG